MKKADQAVCAKMKSTRYRSVEPLIEALENMVDSFRKPELPSYFWRQGLDGSKHVLDITTMPPAQIKPHSSVRPDEIKLIKDEVKKNI